MCRPNRRRFAPIAAEMTISPSFSFALPFTPCRGRRKEQILGTSITTYRCPDLEFLEHYQTSRRNIVTSKLEGQYECSRRFFALQILPLFYLTTTIPKANAATLRRTILDEERERRERLLQKDQEDRTKALRAAFEAVDKASEQLDDVITFMNDEDWKAIRTFSRLFNNSVEREGMERLTRQLSTKQKREDSFHLCQKLTETLKGMDQSAKREDRDGVLEALQSSRQIIAAFQEFKP